MPLFKSKVPDVAALKSQQDIPGLVTVMSQYGPDKESGKYDHAKIPLDESKEQITRRLPGLGALWALLEVAEALGERATAPLVASLSTVEALRVDPSSWRRAGVTGEGISWARDGIIHCLGRTGDPQSFDVLVPFYEQIKAAFQANGRAIFRRQRIGPFQGGLYGAVVAAFGYLRDKRGTSLLAGWLRELVEVPLPQYSDDFTGTVLAIGRLVEALGRIGDPAALPALELCRTIMPNQLREPVDDAIRAVTGTAKTPEEIERELIELIRDIAGGTEGAPALRTRLEKLGPPGRTVFTRMVNDPSFDVSRSPLAQFAVEFALKP